MDDPVISLNHSPLTSPRSSTSSNNPSTSAPVTPMFELSSRVEDMTLTGSSNETDEDVTPPKSATSDNLIPTSPFGAFSFGSNASTLPSAIIPATNEPISPSELPQAGFTFGTCPTTPFIGTPSAEKGQFEYPEVEIGPYDISHTPIASVQPLPLGQTHRRSSIVARPSIDRHAHFDTRSSLSSDRRPSLNPRTSDSSDATERRRPSLPSPYPSPPPTRRSSTLSQIMTVPASGRRPSVLHSATIPASFPTTTSPINSRRTSLMFPTKPLPVNIPPSLLARRGSLPVAQLFGVPSTDHPKLNQGRASLAAPMSSGYTTTTPALYHRRESLMSESAASSGSSRTINQYPSESVHLRRSSHQAPYQASAALLPDTNYRRSSLPYLPNLLPSDSPLATGRPIPRRPSSPPYRKQSYPNNDHPSSPSFRSSERRARQSSSSNSRSSFLSTQHTLSLSSSEESNEEDEDEDSTNPIPGLPPLLGSRGSVDNRPVNISGGPTFNDPWAKTGDAENPVHRRAGGKASEGGGRGGRPALESIPSDDTERGNRSS